MVSTIASLVVFVVSGVISHSFGVFKMSLSFGVQAIIAGLFLLFSILIFYASLKNLPFSKLNIELVKSGPYNIVRHPRYAAITLFIFPAFSVLCNSWLCLLSTIIICLIFRYGIRKEEVNLVRIFGDEYKAYMKRTPRIVPKILIRNLSFFY